VNRKAYLNDDKWCLNYSSNVQISSVKNFQLVTKESQDDEYENVIAEFGKFSKNQFSLTIRHPFSILNGFAFALSAFDK
jgi:hypothetical protein